MAIVEMDSIFVRAIRYLHSSAIDSHCYLGALLDEAIKTSYEPNPELSAFLNLSPVEYPVSATVPAYDSVITSDIKEESRTCSSSDNELELDLLKEDLMCVVCKGMDVAAKNQLLECCECHSLYHQECHDPPIFQEEIELNPTWVCNSCKRQTGKIICADKQGTNIKIPAPLSPAVSNIYPEREVCERNSGSGTESKSLAPAISSSKQSADTNIVKSVASSNLNVISADKRLQIMKKKAAKMQEKRKLNNRL